MVRELAVNPCRRLCSWGPTDEWSDGLRVFRCAGCSSEWTVAEVWTPCNRDGEVPAEVSAARRAAQRT
ncbi:MAG: hypothetical protein QM713_08785 [Arachnia sp.]